MKVLSSEIRRFIIDLYRNGTHTQAAIAELVGSTQSNVSKVIARARRNDPNIPTRRAAAPDALPRQRVFAASQLGSSRRPLSLDEF